MRGKDRHTSQRSVETVSGDKDIYEAYQYIINLYRPVSISFNKGYGIPNGVTVKGYITNMNLDSWQSKIRYYRLRKNIPALEVANKLGIKSATAYLKKYENDCHNYYTSVENYRAICEVIGIEYEDIADEYMLFIASDYDKRLERAIEKVGLSSREFALQYDIEYTTLRHSLKKMHKLSVQTFEKYKLIFEKLEV